jgi:hypothetical protein
MRLPAYLFEIRSIPWTTLDEWGRKGHLTRAWDFVQAWEVDQSSPKTFSRDDGYGVYDEWMVRISDGTWVKRFTNRIDYTGGHVWQGERLQDDDTKFRVFMDANRPVSQIVMDGKPISAKSLVTGLDSTFEI